MLSPMPLTKLVYFIGKNNGYVKREMNSQNDEFIDSVNVGKWDEGSLH